VDGVIRITKRGGQVLCVTALLLSLRVFIASPQSTSGQFASTNSVAPERAATSLRGTGTPTTITDGSGNYHFESWDSDKGLPQNTVHSILQTSDGYLWLTTSDGLVRYDGVRFTIFNIGNTKGIASNRCRSLFEDRDHNLWITAEDGEIIRYRDGSFDSYGTGGNSPDYWVRGIWEDPEGHLFISTRKDLLRWQDGTFVAQARLARCDYYEGFGSIIWCQDGAAVHVRRADLSTAVYTLQTGLSSLNISAAYEDKKGRFWVATRDGGLDCFEGGKLTRYQPDSHYINAIIESLDGALWLGTEGGGLLRFQDGRFKSYTTADGLPENIVTALYQDREGSLWLGTLNRGLARLSKNLITTYAEQQGLSPAIVYPILEDHVGNIWLGTWHDGVNRYRDGSFTHYDEKQGLAGSLITSLAEDREGRVWIGARGGAGWYQNGKFTRLAELGVLPYGVSAILEDRDGNLWFGTEVGLKKFRDGQFTTYTAHDGLAGDDVKVLQEDQRGNIWIGTYGGLTRLKDGTFQSYRQEDGLASNHVRSLYEDGNGVLWVGTYDGGLSRLKDGKITTYTVKDGLFDGGVFQILEDDLGNLWMSCNHGIYRVSKKELEDFASGQARLIHSVSYGTRDGMLSVECNGGTQPAGIKANDGRLWFPTQDGVAVINPSDIQSSSLPPPVVIESCLLDQKPVDVRRTVQIEPGQDSLEIHYTGLSFVKPEQVEFRYRLEGLDKDWVQAGSRRVAYYAHVPPGQYTFVVTAANADGVWNDVGQRLQITVVPPVWRRWWFITLGVLGLVATVFFVYRRRVSQLHRARAAQEAFSRQLIESQENERKRIAAELHDSIGQSLLIIKNRAQFALMKSEGNGAANEQIEEITASASQAITEVREIAYNLRPYHLDRIGLTKTIEAMIEKIAAASGIRFTASIANIDGLLSKEAEINLYRVVQEAINNIVKHSGADDASTEVSRKSDAIFIQIRDTGRGFALTTAEAGPRGFGLISIAERVRMIGGDYNISSTPGQGTTIRIRIDLEGSGGVGEKGSHCDVP
jgi:signal transduction histidine kinase/ligand-binding sensor domain-containing protein